MHLSQTHVRTYSISIPLKCSLSIIRCLIKIVEDLTFSTPIPDMLIAASDKPLRWTSRLRFHFLSSVVNLDLVGWLVTLGTDRAKILLWNISGPSYYLHSIINQLWYFRFSHQNYHLFLLFKYGQRSNVPVLIRSVHVRRTLSKHRS